MPLNNYKLQGQWQHVKSGGGRDSSYTTIIIVMYIIVQQLIISKLFYTLFICSHNFLSYRYIQNQNYQLFFMNIKNKVIKPLFSN